MKDVYFRRQIEDDLERWHNTSDKLVLEIKGGRQIGKTTTILYFAKETYQNVIYVNLAGNTGERFINMLNQSDNYSTKEAVLRYCEYSNLSYTDDQATVLIIDEIQEDRKVYEQIRSFNRELQCDVIVTGSYLQQAKDFFQPAGDVKLLEMFPMNFEEFIWAVDEKAYEYYTKMSIEDICAGDKLEWFKECFELYKEVGGYPIVVKKYLESADRVKVREAQHLVLQSILSELKTRANNLFDFTTADSLFYSIIITMLKEKKGDNRLTESISKMTEQYASFRLSTQECYNVIAWLKEAGFLGYCDKFVFTNNGIEVYPAERLYFNDLGILNYLCKRNNVENTNLDGILSETYVYKVLNENNFAFNFKFTRPAFGVYNDCEIDFCVVNNADIMYGIEVKTGRAQGVSIKELLNKKKIDCAVCFKGETKGGVTNGNEITIPLVLAGKYKFQDENGKKEMKRLDVF